MSQNQSQLASQITPPPHQDTSSPHQPPPWSRPLKQFGLFFVGASFTAASIAISRRSVLRRQFESIPRFYASNPPPSPLLTAHHLPNSSEGSLLGVQALGLATLNVSAFAVMLTGGLSWGFDLSSVEELRERTQRALRKGGYEVNPADEEEFERMVNDVLVRFGMDKIQSEGSSETTPAVTTAKE
ncbi:hypothetical protein PT974_01130 [Cladobotryum mycophilum]|uniref:Altered inheritance of mitochondria protein 11 n=1 Tax=Cladobotryum mycophilum TaxID=491253 RepID=A0ABR0T2V4_9HYPO